MAIPVVDHAAVNAINHVNDGLVLILSQIEVDLKAHLDRIAVALEAVAQNTKPEPIPDHAEIVIGEPK